ncbi:MAG TPA: DUF4132 domain-containing protein, partial [Myxococcales bacterium]|nr:DUF4132 domain-containing protein [Myxococcales bacterium]
MLACATATSTLQALAPHLSMYWFGRTSWDSLPSLLDGAGRDAVAFFDELKVQIADAPADGRRAWADSLAHINSDEAMALLVDAAEHKEVVPLVAQAIARWPRRAMRLLAARAAAKGAGGEAARALLASLVRKDPASVDAVLPGLSAEAVRALESLRQGAAAIAADAPPERLPAILRNPPWIGATPRPLPVLEVKVIAPKDQMAWRPGEQEEWRAHRGYTYVRDVSSTEVQRILKNGGGHTALFRFLPDGPALKAIHAHPFGRWGEMEWLPTLVARFELQILPDVVRAADEHGPGALGVLEPYASAEIAPRMAEMAARSKIGRPHAVAWLLRHPTHAAAGLLAGALGPAGKEKDRACQALRLLAANGHRELVLDAARNTRPPCRDAAQEILDADPLLQFPARLPKLPAWYDAAALPPLLLADRSGKVPAAGVDVLVTMLAFPNADGWYPGIEEVKRALDPASARELAWGLFNLWMTGGASSKESWALQALGALGDDEIARRLVPLIRQWPGEAAHARAVMGLDVLAAIGTDVTLTYLNGIAEKVKFKGLQQRAQEKISEIAEARGLTRDELADRLVPTLGLDDDGSLQLDFGPRTFTVGFDEHLHPYVKDAQGARIKDLPKPNKSDDAEKATAAEERWKALKKDARAASEIQVLRMEQAMCLRRRWPATAFKQLFVDHPLLVHVVRRLIWATYDARGALQATFRVAEDRTFADQADETFT